MVVGAEVHCFGLRLARHIVRSQEASVYGKREPMNCAIKAKELR
jgi:hypothetical protein